MKASRKLLCFGLATLVILCVAPFMGMTLLTPSDAIHPGSSDNLIFWSLRIPRVGSAFFAGAALSTCAVVFQAIFVNPLATPYTLGISGGAALGASIYFFSGLTLGAYYGLFLFALAGGMLATVFVFALTQIRRDFSSTALLLAGVMASFFFSSLVMFIQYWSSASDAVQIMRWLMGSLVGTDLKSAIILCFSASLGSLFLWLKSSEMDLLSTGQDLAASRGLDVPQARILFFLVISIIIATNVAIVGPIGFVGIIIPQICRMILGSQHVFLIPGSFLAGGSFLCLCDIAARTVLQPAELPTGIITSLLGGPFFLWMLLRNKERNFI